MPTYRKVLQQARQRLYEAGQGEQAAQLLMLELASLDAHNLYMEYDEEVPGELLERLSRASAAWKKASRWDMCSDLNGSMAIALRSMKMC